MDIQGFVGLIRGEIWLVYRDRETSTYTGMYLQTEFGVAILQFCRSFGWDWGFLSCFTLNPKP